MTKILDVDIKDVSLAAISEVSDKIAVFITDQGGMDKTAKRVNRLMRGALERFIKSDIFEKLALGDCRELQFPAGLLAQGVIVCKLPRNPNRALATRAGANVASCMGAVDLCVLAGTLLNAVYLIEGILLKSYAYRDHKSKQDQGDVPQKISVMSTKKPQLTTQIDAVKAIAQGVFLTRDLTNAPANHLTTTAFADEIKQLKTLGVDVEILEEDALKALKMNALLCVGQGSKSPSKVAIMRWSGATSAPLALVGKGVVFDTGGISLKPAGGMEDMTMDMGGAGVVTGVMKTLALRKAKAHVIGLVGLVENMPSGDATRPGDVVRSMKGDTIEVINTDAEGRLVLADVLWYTQERFKPQAIIDLATLTGAVIIGLGHEKAGVFSNDDTLCNQFLNAAQTAQEGAWRMPLDPSYDALLKSAIADMKNVGGRTAGSITAAQFLQKFVPPETPWIHLDIAGVASVKTPTPFAPKGATGWGVRALNHMIAQHYETKDDG